MQANSKKQSCYTQSALKASCSSEKEPTLEQVNSWRVNLNYKLSYSSLLGKLLQSNNNSTLNSTKGSYCGGLSMKYLVKTTSGIDVWFPFSDPYPCQQEYIEKVMKAVQGKQNAMLESPTGTGKTISLLSACVAFMKNQRAHLGEGEELTTLVYCTRTHSQIKQVINEIKTLLPYEVNAQVLASKTQFCINDNIKGHYDSHTINHACKQLRKSKQTNEAVLGQRDLMSGLQPNLTKELKSACQFYQGEERFMQEPEDCKSKMFNPQIDMIADQPMHGVQSSKSYIYDVEDLCNVGKEKQLCPYYLAKSRLASSDIVVVPYQYVLDPELRKTLQINLKNSIIIFDEAHNIDSNCEELLSFEYTKACFQNAFNYIEIYQKYQYLRFKQQNVYDLYERSEQLNHLKNFLKKWFENVNKLKEGKEKDLKRSRQSSRDKINIELHTLSYEEFVEQIFDPVLQAGGTTYAIQYEEEEGMMQGYQGKQSVPRCQNELYDHNMKGDPYKEEMKQSTKSPFKQVRRQTDESMNEELDKLLKYAHQCMVGEIEISEELLSQLQNTDVNQIISKGKQRVSVLIDVLSKMKRIRMLQGEQVTSDFRGFIQTKSGQITSFGLMCLNPSYIFQKLLNKENPRSVILTSGTLTPLNLLSTELATKFKVTLENKHIVNEERVYARIINKDMAGKNFDFRYNSKDLPYQYKQLGKLVERLIPKVDGGILIFFTSYYNMDECLKAWESLDLGTAKIFKENKDNKVLAQSYKDYVNHVRDTNTGIFMCTCRGKLSEGLNFTDKLARACLMVGIPYQVINNPRVVLKKEYLTLKYKRSDQISGDSWYKITAMREVNQIIGRCIRHVDDYSCIFLVDQRYLDDCHKDLLSKWIRERVKQFQGYRTLEHEVETFFRQNKIRDQQIRPAILIEDIIDLSSQTEEEPSHVEGNSSSVEIYSASSIDSVRIDANFYRQVEDDSDSVMTEDLKYLLGEDDDGFTLPLPEITQDMLMTNVYNSNNTKETILNKRLHCEQLVEHDTERETDEIQQDDYEMYSQAIDKNKRIKR